MPNSAAKRLITLFYGRFSPDQVESLECPYRPANSPEPALPQTAPSNFQLFHSMHYDSFVTMRPTNAHNSLKLQ
jgi:hypothetical protein